MAERKTPVFGAIALALMLGLVISAVLVTIFVPNPDPSNANQLGAVVEKFANFLLPIIVIGVVSGLSALMAGIGLLRRERWMPSAIALCLAVPSLATVILTIVNL